MYRVQRGIVYTHTHRDTERLIHTHTHICIYIYMYIHTYIDIYIYILISTSFIGVLAAGFRIWCRIQKYTLNHTKAPSRNLMCIAESRGVGISGIFGLGSNPEVRFRV